MGERAASSQCRFCDELAQKGKPTCGSCECNQRQQESCTRTLTCGHLCPGLRGEAYCPPCLVAGCVNAEKGRSGTDWCSICYAEPLRAAPVVTLACGHVFHHHCLHKRR